VALAFAITAVMRPTYEATATIELNKSSGESLDLGIGDSLGQQANSGGEGLLTDLQTETAILQGDSLALAVIEKLGLAKQAPFAAKVDREAAEAGLPLEEAPLTRTRLLKVFSTHLQVQPARGTRLIRVTFSSHDPKQAAEIANALIDSYKSQYLQSHYEASSDASNWLTKQLSELKSNVEDSEKKLTDFEKESGILSLQTGGGGDADNKGEIHSVVIQKLDALNSELTAAEANRIQKEAIYHIVKGGDTDAVLAMSNNPLAEAKSLVFTEGGGTANLERLKEQQDQLKLTLAQASATYGANNRHMKDIETQIAALDKQIRVEMGEIVKRAHADMELAEQTEAEIKRRFSGQQEEASKLNEKTVEFAVLSQEAGSQKKLYEDLYTKLQEANVSAGIKATNITTVDPARAQSMPVRPKLSSNLALGLLFGVLGGLFLAFTVDSLDRTVVSPLEVEEITGMPVIGIIPTFGDRVNAYGAKKIYGGRSRKKKTANGEHSVPDAIWMLDHPESIAAEGFRSLRTSILLSRPGGGPRVILVTSCIPGEGKSTVTANLAVSFAQHGKKVLIMEADMRRPSMKHVMDVSNQTGLSNVLAGSMTLDDAILHGVQVPTLDVLPAGPRPPMPSEMLGSAAFDLLLEQLRSRYDVVLIDSPPALLLTDAVSIASKTDAVVWVARAGAVTRPHLTRAAQMIERSAMPIIGFTLNRMDSSIDPYGYGYGYGYEYRQYGAYYGEENTNEA
jgi:capsular exopolysaccharide synthesis family protein